MPDGKTLEELNDADIPEAGPMGELSDVEIQALHEAGELPEEYANHPALSADDAVEEDDLEVEDEVVEDEEPADDLEEELDDDEELAAADDAEEEVEDVEDDDELPPIEASDVVVENHAERVGEIDDRLNALESERSNLREQLSEGDIDKAEYDEKYSALDNESTDLRAEKQTLSYAAEQSQAEAGRAWERQQAEFFGNDENIMFRAEENQSMNALLSVTITELDRQYREQGILASGDALLEAAANKIRRDLGIDEVQPPADPNQRRRDAAAKRGRQQADQQAGVPETLGGLPAAAESDDTLTDDQFSQLDDMIGNPDPEIAMQAEAIIANFTPEQEAMFARVQARG